MKVTLTDYESVKCDIQAVRIAVFVEEQKLDRDTEFDEVDLKATHAVVYSEGIPIATGRIDLDQDGRVGRVAVISEHRRRGAGSLVMTALEEHARESGACRLWFHAQISAVAFYESLGFEVAGEHFLEEGIAHTAMQKTL